VVFEVASIRPTQATTPIIGIETFPGGRFVASNAPLRTLIRIAYDVDDYQIVGGPGWMDQDRYDVNATSGRDLPPMAGPFGGSAPLREMLRALLRERFKLAATLEDRELPIMLLSVAGADGRLGQRLTRSSIDCAALTAARKPDDGPPPCGVRFGPGSIVLEGAPISQLASLLAGLIGRHVTDRTGLTGTFDLQLSWMPERPRSLDPVNAAPEEPSLFTALREQAGLRVAQTKGLVPVLVITSVERPTEN
jgi:uncharacterized protein (TIGR03435 family)